MCSIANHYFEALTTYTNIKWSEWIICLNPEEFPEIFNLRDVQQSPPHHFENAFDHTLMVVDEMGKILDSHGIQDYWRKVLLLAAILHDTGKKATVRWREDKKKWVFYGHELESAKLCNTFLPKIGVDLNSQLAKDVKLLVLSHMWHCQQEYSDKFIRKICDKMNQETFNMLVLLFEADCKGRIPSKELPERVTNILIPRVKNEYSSRKEK